MSIVVYLIGAPGTGKTTLARSLLGFPEPRPGKLPLPSHYRLIGKPKWTVTARSEEVMATGGSICAAGHYTGATFDGGDTVSYTGALDAMAYWTEHFLKLRLLTLLDGDRFSNSSVLDYLVNHPLSPLIRVLGVHLVASPELLAARRSQRGSNQNPIWMKGRETKARNFAMKLGACELPVLTLDAAWGVAELDLRVSRLVNEVREEMRETENL